MNTYQELPEGYREILSIDLQKNKKLAAIVNGLGIAIAVAMIIAVYLLYKFANMGIPAFNLYDMSEGIAFYFIRFGVLIVGMIVYLILHELVHGITMKYYGSKKVKYGFTGMYAYAGSEDYFTKKPYIVIALAPIVVWGIVLTIINCVVPDSWFWVIFAIQVINISGAAGDLYVTGYFSKLPKDILVQDAGVSMKVYYTE